MPDNVKLPAEFSVPVVANFDPTRPLPPADAPVAPRSLVRKLCEVMDAIGWVAKTGYNEFHKYHYAQEADLVNAIRGELSKRNIFIFPSITKTLRSPLEVETMKWDAERQAKVPSIRKTQLTEVEMDWTFVDGDSGEERTVRFDGVGEDNVDKGLYKALTGCEKYLLMKSFLVPTGDDPEKDSSEDAKNAKEEGTEAAKQVASTKLEEFKRREAAQMAEVQDHKFFTSSGKISATTGITTAFTQAAAPATVTKAQLPSFRRDVEGIENVRGLLRKVTEAKTTDKKTDFLKLVIGETEVSLFDNLLFESPVRGCKDLFTLLATSINEICDLEILTKPSKNPAKPYRNVKAKGSVLMIGPVEIENGVPVIQQRREPGE